MISFPPIIPLSLLNLGFLLTCWCILSSAEQYKGVHINLISIESPIKQNLLRHKKEFEELTGATVSIFGVGYSDLFDQIMGDLRDGSNLYDGFVISPVTMLDFITCHGCQNSPGLEDLTDRVRNDELLNWYEIYPYFRSYNSVYDGKVYTMTMDGDCHYLFYNIDILNKINRTVPKTWEEFAKVAELAHGKDWNQDGIPDFGTCIPRKNYAHTSSFLFSVASSYMQSNGTSQGIFFDPDTFEPLLDTPGFLEGISMYTRIGRFGPEEPNDFKEMIEMIAHSKCAISITWADVGAHSRDTKTTPESTWDKIGAAIPPGSRRVWDYRRNDWNDCVEEPSLCPFASKDHVNHAPFVANGGWSAAIASNTPDNRKDATFLFFSLMSRNSNSDVFKGSGFEPYRYSHFNQTLWEANGYSRRAAKSQIKGMMETLRSPNLVADLRIQGTNTYMEEMAEELIRVNKGEISAEEFIKRVTYVWNGLTEKFGRRNLIQQYRATIGLPPKDFSVEVDITKAGRICFAVLAGILAFCCICLIIFVFFHSNLKVWRYASPAFLYASLVGAIFAYAGIIVRSVYPSHLSCTFWVWLYIVGMAMVFGNIFAKTFRTWQLFRHQKKFFVSKMRDIDILPIALVVVLSVIIILSVWTGMGSAIPTKVEVGEHEYVVVCKSGEHGRAIFWAMFGYFGVLLFIALFLSFNTRHVEEAFNESKTLGLCVYNLTQMLIIVVAFSLALDNNQVKAKYILMGSCLIFGVTVTIGLLFVPKVYTTLTCNGEVHTSTTRNSWNEPE